MEIAVQCQNPTADNNDCVVVGVYEGGTLSPAATLIDLASGGALQALLDTGDFSGACGETQMLYQVPKIAAARVLVLGLGTHGKVKDSQFRKAALAAALALQNARISRVSLHLLDTPVVRRSASALAKILVQAMAEVDYHFDQHKKPADKPQRAFGTMQLIVSEGNIAELAEVQRAAAEAHATARAVAWAKDLANEPGNVCTPVWLAGQAEAMAQRLGIKSTILGPDAMEALGMHLLLGVANGSRQPPRLIILEYWGGAEDQAPIVLVGKGLTFDAGGISLKPADKMDEMKYDMCGGASALAAGPRMVLLMPRRWAMASACSASQAGVQTFPGAIGAYFPSLNVILNSSPTDYQENRRGDSRTVPEPSHRQQRLCGRRGV